MNLSEYTNRDMSSIVVKDGESLCTTALRISQNTSDMIFNCASLCEKFMVNQDTKVLIFFFSDGSKATYEEDQYKNAYRDRLLALFKDKDFTGK